ncbi:MAG TPA: TonB family protein [Cellvibrio sp.]|nr:TonB family protein [Cellvibrio sp.]
MNKMAINDILVPAQMNDIGSVLRIVYVIPLALLATVFLLYAMQQLIHMDQPVCCDPVIKKIPPITMTIPTIVEVRHEEPPVRPVERTLPPVVEPYEPILTVVEPNEFGIGGPMVTEKPPINGFSGIGQMVPFIKVPPQYPQSALSKGVEGYVDVIFDVTELGTTDNIRIVAYEPSSIFNRSVIKAIKNWKYKPNVIDGVPVRTPDVRDRVRFNMDK